MPDKDWSRKTKEKCGPGSGEECGADKRKRRKIIRRSERAINKANRQKGKKGKKKFIAGEEREVKSTYTIPATQGEDVQAHVIKPGQKTIVTDVSTDNGVTTTKGYKESDTSGKTIVSTGDEAKDLQQAKNIGLSSDLAQQFVEGHNVGTEEKTKQGLSKNYFSRGLYKKTNKGLTKQKGYDYSTKTIPGGEEISPGVTSSDKTTATELHTVKGGGARQKIYKSTEGMTRGEKSGHRKLARKTHGGDVKYISHERIQKKKERMDKSMERGTDKDFKRGKNYKQNQRRKKRGIGPTKDLGPNSMDILAKYK